MDDIKIRIAPAAVVLGAVTPTSRMGGAARASSPRAIPLSQVDVPITRVPWTGDVAADEVLLESPRSAAETWYLPRYRLGTRVVSGTQHYEALIEQQGQAWVFKVHLRHQPSNPAWPGQGARPLNPACPVSLTYLVELSSGVTRRDLAFQTVTPDESGLWATLRLETRPEQDELYRALTRVEGDARLIVHRRLRFGSPSRPADPTRLAEVEQELKQVKQLMHEESLKYPPRPGMDFVMPPAHVIQLLVRSRALDAEQASLRAAWSSTHFWLSDVELPLTPVPEPLFLSERLHDYVYEGVHRPEGGKASGLLRHLVKGRVYFQEERRPQRFYYLPDRFALASRTGSALPQLTVRATSDINTYAVEYVAAPVVDLQRLNQDAADALRALAQAASPTPVPQLELEPLLGDALGYSVRVPDGTAWTPRSRPGVAVDLHTPFRDVLTLSAEGLKQLYDALFVPGAALFRGTLTVELGVTPKVWAREDVPFVGQVPPELKDTAWDVLFDPSVPARFLSPVDVVGEPALFNGRAEVAVEFEHGERVVLSAASPRGQSRVGQPIGDFVLGKPDAGTFRYRLTHGSGAGSVTSDWKVGQGSTLRLRSV
ncbi:MAG: hypothetical protein ABW123_27995 [Cystobacter sp.]